MPALEATSALQFMIAIAMGKKNLKSAKIKIKLFLERLRVSIKNKGMVMLDVNSIFDVIFI